MALRPKKQNISKPTSCWGCRTWKHFPSLSKMLEHIENNECHYGWTIQHLNALAEECRELARFIIPGQELWFRAGAPPRKTKQTDYRPYDDVFVCSICAEEYKSRSQLREHLKEQECSHDYPSVLRCPQCPDTGYQRLSELFGHLEECHSWGGRVASLVQSLQRKFEDPGVQRRLDMCCVRLRASKRRPGMLRVAVEIL